MKRVGLWAAAVLLGLVLAEIAASALYCVWSDKWGLLAWPYNQWLVAAPYWLLNWWMTVLVVGSAFGPLLILAMVGFGVVRKYGGSQGQRLYGRAAFRDPATMQDHGINVKRRPL